MQLGRHGKHTAAASGLQQARNITVVLVLLTAGLSISSVQYLSHIVVRKQGAESAAEAAHADWHGMLSRVEHNLESHLPHQVADELASLGIGQRPHGGRWRCLDTTGCKAQRS